MKDQNKNKLLGHPEEDSGLNTTISNLNALLQTTLDASFNGIVSMSAIRDQNDNGEPGTIIDFRITSVNKAVQQTLFMEPAALIDKRLLEIFPGNKSVGFLDFYSRVASGGEPERSVQFYTNQFGLKAWFEVSAVNLDKDRIVVAYNNVTSQKSAEVQHAKKEEQLGVAIQELRRSNENLQEFAYVASHDLQEPLRKVQSFGQILKKRHGNNLDGEGNDIIDRMASAAERMSLLISDLLNYSRLSVKISPLRETSLKAILKEVTGILEQPIKEKRAIIEIGELDSISVDPFQITQMFQNLLTNSLKFNRDGIAPHITISSNRELVDLETLEGHFETYNSEMEYCVITFADNGIGFNQSQAENIFGAFHRLHGKSQYPGTGIGLAIVKKVVENHKGFVFAKGEPEEGATFTIYLPV